MESYFLWREIVHLLLHIQDVAHTTVGEAVYGKPDSVVSP